MRNYWSEQTQLLPASKKLLRKREHTEKYLKVKYEALNMEEEQR